MKDQLYFRVFNTNRSIWRRKMVALQISPKIESLHGLGRQAKTYKCLYGILQLLQGSHLDNFPQKTLKLGRFIAFFSLTFFSLINIRKSPQCPHVSAMGYHRSPSSSPAPPLPSLPPATSPATTTSCAFLSRRGYYPPSHARCVTVRVCQR